MNYGTIVVLFTSTIEVQIPAPAVVVSCLEIYEKFRLFAYIRPHCST